MGRKKSRGVDPIYISGRNLRNQSHHLLGLKKKLVLKLFEVCNHRTERHSRNDHYPDFRRNKNLPTDTSMAFKKALTAENHHSSGPGPGTHGLLRRLVGDAAHDHRHRRPDVHRRPEGARPRRTPAACLVPDPENIRVI